jgi:nucleotide-binding universal stress UspA family protein
MIVVGSRGRSPLENRLVGSTTRNVARTSVRPLLVERIAANDDGPVVVREHLFEHVLFAMDFSENAERAFEFIPTLYGATQRVTLLNVVGPEGRDRGLTSAEARERLERSPRTSRRQGSKPRCRSGRAAWPTGYSPRRNG